MPVAITAAAAMTPVGFTAEATAAAVRAGVSRVGLSEEFDDAEGNPVSEARLRWPDDEEQDADEQDSAEAGSGDAPDEAAAGLAPGGESEEEGERLRAAELALEETDRVRDRDEAELDAPGRVARAARESLERLLELCADVENTGRRCHLLLGVAAPMRPGPRYEGARGEVAAELLAAVGSRHRGAELELVPAGHTAGMSGLALAARILAQDAGALCIVGGMDSLLSPETMAWLEREERLRSETFGRNHGLAPGEAAGFLAVEDGEYAARAHRPVLAELMGVGVAVEPAPFSSASPSLAEGITEACRAALVAASCPPGEVGLVVGDLDGEFHRSRDWAYADVRCFTRTAPRRRLLHPAAELGTLGAATAPVLVAIAAAALARRWVGTDRALVFCSDDAGGCGSAVLAATGT